MGGLAVSVGAPSLFTAYWEYPLALISPASEKTISSTLGELRHLTRTTVVVETERPADALASMADSPARPWVTVFEFIAAGPPAGSSSGRGS